VGQDDGEAPAGVDGAQIDAVRADSAGHESVSPSNAVNGLVPLGSDAGGEISVDALRGTREISSGFE
jgi:hypothetical protein